MKKYPVGEKLILPDSSVAPISKAYRSGNHLFVSGQLAFKPGGQLSTQGVEDQTELCLNNIEGILSDEGLSRSNIVKLTVWLAHVGDFAKFNEVYQSFFGDHRPARSTVRADLMLQGARVEIEAVAAY